MYSHNLKLEWEKKSVSRHIDADKIAHYAPATP
jgi:hypothetical protein